VSGADRDFSSADPRRDPLRRLAQERGRILAELGVRPDDARWTRMEGETLASLVSPALQVRLPAPLRRVLRRFARLFR
jgi:hypothetical protein